MGRIVLKYTILAGKRDFIVRKEGFIYGDKEGQTIWFERQTGVYVWGFWK